MDAHVKAWGMVKHLTWKDASLIVGVLAVAWAAASVLRWAIRHLAEHIPARLRLTTLRLVPISRLVIGIAAVVVIVPMLIEPEFRNVIALAVSVGVVFAFAFKDYASCLLAGLVTVLENTYQPGDWIEVDGTYGEVKAIGLRAVRVVTPDDTEVSIPHARLWSASIFNASSGHRSLLCVADFYLHPEHDASLVRKRLTEVAHQSAYREPESPITVIIVEQPWGTHYRLKAYVHESREQFLFITDLTVRGKEALCAMGIRFAHAVYADTKH